MYPVFEIDQMKEALPNLHPSVYIGDPLKGE
jgi:hypothetical protein